MTLFLVAVAVGILVGLGTGGRLTNLSHLRYRAWPLILGAFAAQMVLGDLTGLLRSVTAVLDCAAVAVWLGANRPGGRRVSGADLCGLGIVLNAAAIAANGGMPVSRHALSAAGLNPKMNVSSGHLYKHVVMTGRSRLHLLGDIIPVQAIHTVISAGDLLMLVGIAMAVCGGTRASGRSHHVRLANLASRTPSAASAGRID